MTTDYTTCGIPNPHDIEDLEPCGRPKEHVGSHMNSSVEWMADIEDPQDDNGINPNTGRPYRMSAEQRAEVGRRLAEARRAKAAGGGTRKPPPRRATRKAASKEPDYRDGVEALLQAPIFALGMLSRFSPDFGLDALALSMQAPRIASAVNLIALEDAKFAAILERMLAVGPYGALFSALVPLGLQVLANHRVLAPNPQMGIYDPEDLLDLAKAATDDNGG